jgi:T5orf172 domain
MRNKFSDDEIFGGTQVIKSLDNLPKNKFFRLSLSTLATHWKGFKRKDEVEALKSIFHVDYFNDSLFVTDSISLPVLLTQEFYSLSNEDKSGFVYIYTFEDKILAGKFQSGFLFFTSTNYKAKIKVGCTTRNVFYRIKQQVIQAGAALSDPPILLAAFWVPRPFNCEAAIHNALSTQQVTDSKGQPFHFVGTEYFYAVPKEALPDIYKLVLRNRAEYPIEKPQVANEI